MVTQRNAYKALHKTPTKNKEKVQETQSFLHFLNILKNAN